jgi:hypothetical protein
MLSFILLRDEIPQGISEWCVNDASRWVRCDIASDHMIDAISARVNGLRCWRLLAIISSRSCGRELADSGMFDFIASSLAPMIVDCTAPDIKYLAHEPE